MNLGFTIHFATINTFTIPPLDFKVITFTIHFATINTQRKLWYFISNIEFTIHFATINTVIIVRVQSATNDLQYTLLLLIQIVKII